MADEFVIQRAERKLAMLRLAFCGAPGAGKTRSSLEVAKGIVLAMIAAGRLTGTLEGKIGVIDTEHGSASLYSRLMPFDVINLEEPYTTPRYIKALETFERSGYPIVIIDQISHAWAGAGGLLEKKSEIAKKDYGGNEWSAFNDITPEQNAFIERLLKSSCHLITTMRSKVTWVIEDREKHGRTTKVPKAIGTAPIQRGGTEYEFTTVLNLDTVGNIATVVKDRTELFGPPGEVVGRLSEKNGTDLCHWLYTGGDADPPALPEPTALERLEALVLTSKASFTGCSSQPDLAKLFTHAVDTIKAFKEVDVPDRRLAIAQVTAAKDVRKAELGTTAAGLQMPPPPAAGAETIAPDDLVDLERYINGGPVSVEAVCTHFKVARLAFLPAASSQQVMDWVDEHAVTGN